METKLDQSIADVSYILDCLMAYRNIIQCGCCNDCKGSGRCWYEPKWGQIVRYNCPLYEKEVNNIHEN